MSLENHRGPLGPSGVRIPPPPLTTRIASNDAGSSKERGGQKARLSHRVKPLRTAMDCRATVAHRRRDPTTRAKNACAWPAAAHVDRQERRRPNSRAASGDSTLAHACVLHSGAVVSRVSYLINSGAAKAVPASARQAGVSDARAETLARRPKQPRGQGRRRLLLVQGKQARRPCRW
jgi:hypothetical protein